MCKNKEQCFDVSGFLENKTEGDLVDILYEVQDRFGYVPREVIVQISKALGVPVSKLYGVVTFYSKLSLKPTGAYCVSVCLGTACYVNGAEDILDEMSKQMGIAVGDTTEDLFFSLEESKCVGACADAPVVMINDTVYRKAKKEDVGEMIANIKSTTVAEE